jgi:hypothetical protein
MDRPYTISRGRSTRRPRYTVCVPVGEDQHLKLIGSIVPCASGWHVTGSLAAADHASFRRAVAWLLAHEYGR